MVFISVPVLSVASCYLDCIVLIEDLYNRSANDLSMYNVLSLFILDAFALDVK